jgi:deoxyribonuclease (pyrimidine dimer)
MLLIYLKIYVIIAHILILEVFMTRVNLVEVSSLYDQHLIAEHKEILQLMGSYRKSLYSKNGIFGIPREFTLNKGHVKFFYNKIAYLHKRFKEIQIEMELRGFKSNKEFSLEHVKPEHYNDWSPSNDDIDLVFNRIKEKLDKRPGWYKFTSPK